MSEFIEICFAPVNLLYTTMLIVVFLYWISVILGAIDMEFFHCDLSHGGEIGGDFHGDAGFFHGVLEFFNFGEVPVMIILSFSTLIMWALGISYSQNFGIPGVPMALLVFIPNLAIGLLVAKVLTNPLKKLFKKLDNEEFSAVDVVGTLCAIRTGKANVEFGQAQVLIDKADLLINVRTIGDEVLHKGDEAMVVEYHPDGDYYSISGLD